MASHTISGISVKDAKSVRRAELVFTGVDQASPSFEGRVFLNNPGATEDTPRTLDAGYAGSFHVYGYGAVAPPGMAGAPIEKRVRVADAALRAALGSSDDLSVTVVAVPADAVDAAPERPFEHVHVVFDRAATEP
jgi:hypothetical protein